MVRRADTSVGMRPKRLADVVVSCINILNQAVEDGFQVDIYSLKRESQGPWHKEGLTAAWVAFSRNNETRILLGSEFDKMCESAAFTNDEVVSGQ